MKQRPVAEKGLPAVWDTMATAAAFGNNSSSTNSTADIKVDLTQLPLVTTESGEKVNNATETHYFVNKFSFSNYHLNIDTNLVIMACRC
jgi:hypothetical protein